MAFRGMNAVPPTELMLTCVTPSEGEIAIKKGDAVKLTGPYEVNTSTGIDSVFFGQALCGASDNDVALPVKVRGVAVFEHDALPAPVVDGEVGVWASLNAPGKVTRALQGRGIGLVLKVDEESKQVHVLL